DTSGYDIVHGGGVPFFSTERTRSIDVFHQSQRTIPPPRSGLLPPPLFYQGRNFRLLRASVCLCLIAPPPRLATTSPTPRYTKKKTTTRRRRRRSRNCCPHHYHHNHHRHPLPRQALATPPEANLPAPPSPPPLL
ncbi:unnamed protein product, partial [Ectocarpus sp. 13 AM-2016]